MLEALPVLLFLLPVKLTFFEILYLQLLINIKDELTLFLNVAVAALLLFLLVFETILYAFFGLFQFTKIIIRK